MLAWALDLFGIEYQALLEGSLHVLRASTRLRPKEINENLGDLRMP